MHWNLMNNKEFGSLKLLKLKYRKGDQIIQSFWRIGSPQEIRSSLFNLRNLQKPERSTTVSSTTHWNLMNDEEVGSFKLLKLKYKRGDQIIQPFSRISSPKQIRLPLFYLKKFQKPQKTTTASCRIYWHLMNEEEFGSFKLPKLKYRRADQIIQLFWRIGFPEEIRSSLFNLKKISKTWKNYCWIM